MTTANDAGTAAASPADTSSRKLAALHGAAQWFGEAVIGLIPLIVYELIHRYSNLPGTAVCPRTVSGINVVACVPAAESSGQEVCILAVVISGLAVLSTVPLGQKNRRKITIWTRILILFAIIALIFGSLLYGVFTAHLDRNADTVTYYVLLIALLSSLFLAVEGAILDA